MRFDQLMSSESLCNLQKAMMWKATILLVVVAACAVVHGNPVCTPGSSKKESCNTCLCSAGGTMWSCTKQLCLPTEPNADPDRPVPVPGGAACKAGATWKESCNSCVCANGLPSCTKKVCVAKREVGDNGRCTQARRWKMDCNTCSCEAGGYPTCTLMACL